jgi:leucine dehydrogenase
LRHEKHIDCESVWSYAPRAEGIIVMPNSVFESLAHKDHEQVIYCYDQTSKLKAIIAIHSTALGPALGGCRMWHYASEDEALNDVLRLSRGMTYKAAVAGLNLGGGKAVIIGDRKDKNEALFRSFGRFVEGLAGRYITAEDVGTSVKDMEWVRMETPHVTGISRALGGSGDPSPVTAFGVFHGIRAAAKYAFGKESLSSLSVAIQGAGQVGYHLAKHLVQAGAKVVMSDIDQEAVKRAVNDLRVTAVGVDEIYDVECDIFAPCALGATINHKTLPRLKCKVIAGAANNQLEDDKTAAPILQERGILYAPDYVINAGGLINVANELEGYNRERALQQAENIFQICTRVFETAAEQKIPTFRAADNLAQERIAQISHIKRTFTGYRGGQIRGVS